MIANGPKPPIGQTDFKQIREDGLLYVDKSGLVGEVLQDVAQVILLPRPRRFGKSLNLSMLRYFFEKTQPDGRNAELFHGLAVQDDRETWAHLGRYPVLFLTFKDVRMPDFRGTLDAVREVVRQAFEEHRYLLDLGVLPGETADRFRMHLRGEGSEAAVYGALPDLVGRLARFHEQRVIVLIDEYDTPIQHGYLQGFYGEVTRLFRNLFSSLLKDNADLFKGVLTGILRVARESLFSGLNNLAVRSLLEDRYASRFGFTEDEVRSVLRLGDGAPIPPQVRHWYDGYCFGGRSIYNPWSVVGYAESGKLGAYWANTSSNELIRKLLQGSGVAYSVEMETLLAGESIDDIALDDNIVLRDIGQQPGALWSFLVMSGYLKATDLVASGVEVRGTLTIPNREVHDVYRKVFREWLDRSLGNRGAGGDVREALLSGDAPALERLLGDVLRNVVSFHDTARPAEVLYHVLLLGLLAHLDATHEVRSNRESGLGRADILVRPRQRGRPGAVLEVKVASGDAPADVDRAASAALGQIRERDYAAECRSAGADPIHEYAVVCRCKRVWVRTAGSAGLVLVVNFFSDQPMKLPDELEGWRRRNVPDPQSPPERGWPSPWDAESWQQAVATIEEATAELAQERGAVAVLFRGLPALAVALGRLLKRSGARPVSLYQFMEDAARWACWFPDGGSESKLPDSEPPQPVLVQQREGGRGLLVALDGTFRVSPASMTDAWNSGAFQMACRVPALAPGEAIRDAEEARSRVAALALTLAALRDEAVGDLHLLLRIPAALAMALGWRLEPRQFGRVVLYQYDARSDSQRPVLELDHDGVHVAA